MRLVANSDYEKALNEQKIEVRNFVLAGLEQIKQKISTKVCDRLENK